MIEHPLKLHHDALVADLHCDTALYVKGGRNLAVRNDHGHVDFPRLKEGGVDLQVFACFVPARLSEPSAHEWTNELLRLIRGEIERNADHSALATNTADASAVIDSGRLTAILAIENGQAIDSDLNNLKHFYNLGVRALTLCHNRTHSWCGSSSDPERPDVGLTGFGRDVVRCMNDIGMIIDVSHASERAVDDVLATSEAPIMASHSCARPLCNHDRNLSDNQITGIAESGGLIGVNFCGDFLNDQRRLLSTEYIKNNLDKLTPAGRLMDGEHDASTFDENFERCKTIFAEWDAHLHEAPTTVAMVADHIDHIVNLVGNKYVAFGSDFDGIFSPPDGLDDCSKFPNLTLELARRGYTESALRNVLGLNFLRLFERVCH